MNAAAVGDLSVTPAGRYAAGADVIIYEADHGERPADQPVLFGPRLADPTDHVVPGRPTSARQPQVSQSRRRASPAAGE